MVSLILAFLFTGCIQESTTRTPALELVTTALVPVAIDLTDLDGDGDLDLVVLETNGPGAGPLASNDPRWQLTFYDNSGGSFSSMSVVNVSAGATHLAIGPDGLLVGGNQSLDLVLDGSVVQTWSLDASVVGMAAVGLQWQVYLSDGSWLQLEEDGPTNGPALPVAPHLVSIEIDHVLAAAGNDLVVLDYDGQSWQQIALYLLPAPATSMKEGELGVGTVIAIGYGDPDVRSATLIASGSQLQIDLGPAPGAIAFGNLDGRGTDELVVGHHFLPAGGSDASNDKIHFVRWADGSDPVVEDFGPIVDERPNPLLQVAELNGEGGAEIVSAGPPFKSIRVLHNDGEGNFEVVELTRTLPRPNFYLVLIYLALLVLPVMLIVGLIRRRRTPPKPPPISYHQVDRSRFEDPSEDDVQELIEMLDNLLDGGPEKAEAE